MTDKVVIFENKEVGQIGTFSVGGVPNSRYDKEVGICVARDGIEMTAKFFFKRLDNPKICGELDNLEKAMLEEGAEEANIIVIG